MRINVCHRKQTFLWRTEKATKTPKTEIRISPAAHVINSNRAQGDMRIWNISMRSPQVRVFSKTSQQGHAGLDAVVIFSSLQPVRAFIWFEGWVWKWFVGIFCCCCFGVFCVCFCWFVCLGFFPSPVA